ncbi:MAG: ketoacyl-ACP synthase III [Firmicutes bacterium]|nr:ketoacyl-ACP synthase III [Bacillota bacterium]
MLQKAIGILGTGAKAPDRVLTNADLERMVETSDEWIVSRTGIRERRIAAKNEAASDLAAEAAARAIAAARIDSSQIGLIICATVTPDMLFPSTACLIQAKLGLSEIPAFDLSAGCSGFAYALAVGAQLAQGGYEYVLVVGVDVLSKITDYTDRSTCVLFGDGAGAAVLGPVPEGYGILGVELGADGSGAELLKMPAGGSLKPASLDTVTQREHFIKMAGNDVFKFAVRVMDSATTAVLKKAHLSPDDVDWFVPHQANVRIINAAAARLGVSADRFYVNVERYGNTSSASIAIALDELNSADMLRDGENVVLVGFGAGLTWAALVLRWWKRGEGRG